MHIEGIPGGSVMKNPPARAGTTGLIPDLGRPRMLWSSEAPVLQLLRLCSRVQGGYTAEPLCALQTVLRERSHHDEKPTQPN